MGNLQGYGGAARSGLKDRAEYVEFWDDFLGANNIDNSGRFSATGDRGWYLLSGDAGYTVNTEDAGRGGILKLLTDETAADRAEFQLNGESFHLTPGKRTWWAGRLAADDVDDMDVFVGLAQTSTTVLSAAVATSAESTDLDRVGFHMQHDGGLDAVVGKATTLVNKDTGVDLADGALATFAATSRRLAFEYDGVDTVRFFVDDVEVCRIREGEAAGGVTAALPTDLPLTLTVGARALDDGVERTLWMDYHGVRMER